MAFKVERENTRLQDIQVGAQNYNTGEQAFRAAMGNMTKFITDHWDAANGIANRDGPMNDAKFKVYVNRRPGTAEINLRYDYGFGSPEVWETNNIFWRILEV